MLSKLATSAKDWLLPSNQPLQINNNAVATDIPTDQANTADATKKKRKADKNESELNMTIPPPLEQLQPSQRSPKKLKTTLLISDQTKDGDRAAINAKPEPLIANNKSNLLTPGGGGIIRGTPSSSHAAAHIQSIRVLKFKGPAYYTQHSRLSGRHSLGAGQGLPLSSSTPHDHRYTSTSPPSSLIQRKRKISLSDPGSTIENNETRPRKSSLSRLQHSFTGLVSRSPSQTSSTSRRSSSHVLPALVRPRLLDIATAVTGNNSDGGSGKERKNAKGEYYDDLLIPGDDEKPALQCDSVVTAVASQEEKLEKQLNEGEKTVQKGQEHGIIISSGGGGGGGVASTTTTTDAACQPPAFTFGGGSAPAPTTIVSAPITAPPTFTFGQPQQPTTVAPTAPSAQPQQPAQFAFGASQPFAPPSSDGSGPFAFGGGSHSTSTGQRRTVRARRSSRR